MKANNQSSIAIEKMDKTPLIYSNNTNKKSMGFFSRYKSIIIVSLVIAVVIAVIAFHFHYKYQINQLTKETNDEMALLEKQREEIEHLNKVLKQLDNDLVEISDKRTQYIFSLSDSYSSTERLKKQYDQLQETLKAMNEKIGVYEDENNKLRQQIERKKKDSLSVIH